MNDYAKYQTIPIFYLSGVSTYHRDIIWSNYVTRFVFKNELASTTMYLSVKQGAITHEDYDHQQKWIYILLCSLICTMISSFYFLMDIKSQSRENNNEKQ